MMQVCGVRAAIAVALVIGVSACKDSNGPSGDPIDTPLQCETEPCTLPLEERATVVVTLVSHSCAARENEIHVTSPSQTTLTADACYEAVGRTWDFGPFNAGTELGFRIDSFEQQNPPAFTKTGAYPQWTLTFEDGGDADFNDIVLQVVATPVP